MLGIERRAGESVIIDLQGLIDEAIEAAGPNGIHVQEALKRFTANKSYIEVKVQKTKMSKVQLGFEAARNIIICRDELDMNPRGK